MAAGAKYQCLACCKAGGQSKQLFRRWRFRWYIVVRHSTFLCRQDMMPGDCCRSRFTHPRALQRRFISRKMLRCPANPNDRLTSPGRRVRRGPKQCLMESATISPCLSARKGSSSVNVFDSTGAVKLSCNSRVRSFSISGFLNILRLTRQPWGVACGSKGRHVPRGTVGTAW